MDETEKKFDVAEYCRKLRTSKRPPYKCPVAECSKVYRSLCGLQHHLLTIDHDAPAPARTPSSAGRKKGRWTKQNRPSPATSQLLDTPPVMSLTYAEAQNTVEFELDGRVTRVNIHEQLEVHSIGDAKIAKAIEKQMETKPLADMQVAVPQSTKPYYPEPVFRVLDTYAIKDAPPMPTSYIRFVERPAEEMDADVEYEMDEHDCAWLDLVNESRIANGIERVPVDAFEILMDRLEKESYFQVQKLKSSEAEEATVTDDDAVCCICMIGECQASNAILFCDMCNLAVHQDCYGVPYIPEGQWLCRRCLQSPSRAVGCILCPNKGGAFKQTDSGSWVHVVCAMWIPEVRFANPVFLEPVDSIELIPAARWKLKCYLCRKKGVGTCIQCHKTNCYMPFHVSCAQQAGLCMKMTKTVTGTAMEPGTISFQRTVYCGTHSSEAEQNDNSLQTSSNTSHSERRPVNKRWSSTSISIPTIPLDRIQEIATLVDIEKKSQFIMRLLAFWSLKRQLYNGVPLLRRLQISNSAHSADVHHTAKNVRAVDKKDAVEVTRVRQHMERARLLCELLRKRERLKAKLYKLKERCLELELQSFVCFLRRLWELIQARDRYNIFSEPVDTSKVAGYTEIVKHPMDLSTMRNKLENFQYPTLDAFEEDFMLMINNCMLFNARDTVYFKAAVRMKNKCGSMICQARSDLSTNFIDLKTGMFMPLEELPDCKDVLRSESPEPKAHTSMELSVPTNIEKINAQVASVVESCKMEPSLEDISQLQELLKSAEALPGGPGRSKLIRVIKNHIKTARRKLTMRTSPRSSQDEHSKQKGSVSRQSQGKCKKTDASAK